MQEVTIVFLEETEPDLCYVTRSYFSVFSMIT